MNSDLVWPVVVGVDGSTSAAAAIDVAAREAMARGVPLRLVHAYVWPIFYAALANVPYRSSDWEPAPETMAIVDAAAGRVRQAHPGLEVQTAVAAGAGGPVLVTESAHASLVVVGGRGAGGFAGLLSGSVASHVSSHGHCPVIVVRAGARVRPDGQVTVGMDGTPSSRSALLFAFDVAKLYRVGVEVVHAVAPDTHQAASGQSAEAWLTNVIEETRRDYPTVDVRQAVVAGGAIEALIEHSRTARLVVVGTRGRSELTSLALGSVGRDLIRRAVCPVAIVHGSFVSAPPAVAPTRSGT